MTATCRTPAEIDAGLEGYVDGYRDEYLAAKVKLEAIHSRFLAWADTVGHDATKSIAPEWARPVIPGGAGGVGGVIAADVATAGMPGMPLQEQLFELETVPKRKSRSKPKTRTRRERKQMSDLWASSTPRGPVGG